WASPAVTPATAARWSRNCRENPAAATLPRGAAPSNRGSVPATAAGLPRKHPDGAENAVVARGQRLACVPWPLVPGQRGPYAVIRAVAGRCAVRRAPARTNARSRSARIRSWLCQLLHQLLGLLTHAPCLLLHLFQGRPQQRTIAVRQTQDAGATQPGQPAP